jgi:hypothetical protein
MCNTNIKDGLTLRLSPFDLPTLFVTMTVTVESTSKQPAISRETRLKKNSTSTRGNADPVQECVTFTCHLTASALAGDFNARNGH